MSKGCPKCGSFGMDLDEAEGEAHCYTCNSTFELELVRIGDNWEWRVRGLK